ncbi:iron-sulfur cluster insertion protein ErpA [Telmatospirillum siberiense]|uniref:Iron-sulfur cluster insertion protein ErpA n=1 Tax=Telmatospirillum siberiense TaxID=382514 RepID=A0A2N3PTF0_9PROT|nr:iron-sulfur cluster insertion protein ErpA [Telmatospirillum siberiense]PKU23673.1 iron-sulfur cluster insertion protein ErpA [Telmatospirillum siberiense]
MEATVLERQVLLTENAARRVKKLRELEGNPELMLRLSVSGGGCSGFSYGFSLDDKTTEDDQKFDYHGVTLVIDTVSLDLLAGSTIDFVEDLVGSAFTVKNPNATSTCGCGSSFSV